ncbi:MAG: hypothetical protein EXS36_16835, partial [Pedosphaera sp.]|nr:hypothetical protein [Pedosphaera sp.]
MKTNKLTSITASLALNLFTVAALRSEEKPAEATAVSAAAEKPDSKVADTKPDSPPTTPEKPLRLNFRNAPLEMVLNYLSEAAGFIIVPETEIRGKIDVWSNQPVSQNEALSILDTALTKNGLSALRNGRTLTIVSRETAKRRDIPVKSGN